MSAVPHAWVVLHYREYDCDTICEAVFTTEDEATTFAKRLCLEIASRSDRVVVEQDDSDWLAQWLVYDDDYPEPTDDDHHHYVMIQRCGTERIKG